VGHFFLQVADREAMACQLGAHICSNERTRQPVPGKENIHEILDVYKHKK